MSSHSIRVGPAPGHALRHSLAGAANRDFPTGQRMWRHRRDEHSTIIAARGVDLIAHWSRDIFVHAGYTPDAHSSSPRVKIPTIRRIVSGYGSDSSKN